VSEDNRGGTVAQVELGQDVAEVRLDRRLADEESGGDFGIGLTLADFAEHILLAPGEKVRRLRARGSPAASDQMVEEPV